MKTIGNTVRGNTFSPPATKANRWKKEVEKLARGVAKMAKGRYRIVWEDLTAAIFTATLFLGGSYLFFIKLAEYGW